MKKILVVSIFFMAYFSVKAEKIGQGFVINLNKDTIYGSFKLQRIKEAYFKPFNWGMFSLSVNFTSKDGQTTEYLPTNLIGFDFKYDDINYRFRSLKIEGEDLQSFFASDAPSHVFAQMDIEGTISYYTFRFNYDVFRKYKGRSDFRNYYVNHYAKTSSGLVLIHRNFKKNELAVIMKEDLKLEDSFIDTIPKDYRLDEIEEVINSYNIWKNKKKNI